MEATGIIGIMQGLYRVIRYMLGLYWDNGKEAESYYLGFGV